MSTTSILIMAGADAQDRFPQEKLRSHLPNCHKFAAIRVLAAKHLIVPRLVRRAVEDHQMAFRLGAAVKDLATLPEADLMALGERAFRRRVAAMIYTDARTLVAEHRRLRHRLVLVTSATRAQAAPVAASLSIADLRCTELQVSDGLLTGEFTPCHGDAKRRAVLDWLAEQGIDPSRTYFYSDGDEDLPLLEAVGVPVAVNAKPRLAEVAAERHWPELEFVETGTPTGAPTGSPTGTPQETEAP